mmetsp:Transcript_19200/g.32181  ORF Transcript_19200/g.32181 Transcript_19200/m.32181 type:complete len:213 (-) Transcript_19200:1996-2634(-)
MIPGVSAFVRSVKVNRCPVLGVVSVLGRRGFLSAPQLPAHGCADVFKIPLFSDNYCYVIVDRVTNHAAVVDPGQAEPVRKAISQLQQEKQINFTSILATHKHDDHVGGNKAMKQFYSDVRVIGTGYEEIPCVDQKVKHDDTFTIGSLNVRTLFTPCHTTGHVCFYITPSVETSSAAAEGGGTNTFNAPILFSGDTLFAGGCGRFFEGTGMPL